MALLKFHKPSMLILLETKMKEHTTLTMVLGFDNQIQATAERLSGGDSCSVERGIYNT